MKSIINNCSNLFIKNSVKRKYFLISFSLILFHLILIIFWPFTSFLVQLPELSSYTLKHTEFSPVEIMQALLYFIAFITSLKNLLIKKSEKKTFFFIVVITFLLFAEETSWMQHYTNYSLPLIQNINVQNEVNIHNLYFLQFGSLRDGNYNLNLLLKSQNLFRILFCFYFFFLPLISLNKGFKMFFKKFKFLKPSKAFTISLSITLLFNIMLTLLIGFPSVLSNPIAEYRELIYATYICLYILDLRSPY